MVNKRLINTGVEAAPAAFDPLQNFETVTYTGNGSTQKITGYIRKGAAFNGSSSQINTNANLLANTTWSVSLWFNTNDKTNNQAIFSQYASGDATRFFAWINNSGTQIRITLADNDYNNSFSISNNTWHHLVITKDSSGFSTYLDNGTAVTNSDTASMASSTIDFIIGSNGGSSPFFDGKIDQVRIFNKALSQSEVDTLEAETYDSSTKSTTDIFGDGSAVALYELDEDADNTGIVANVSEEYARADMPIVTDADFDGTTSGGQTVAFWFKTDTSGTGYHVALSSNTSQGGASTGSSIFIGNTTSLYSDESLGFWDYNGATTSSYHVREGTNTYRDGTYRHCAIVSTSTSKTIYINGVSKTISYGQSGSASGNMKLTDITFGSGLNTSSVTNCTGIKDVRVFEDALTSQEVGYLYNENASQIALLDNKLEYTSFPYNGTPTNVNFLGMAFQPDLVWIKNRNGTSFHNISDSVRGSLKIIQSNTTTAEQNAPNGGVLSFDSNGFTLGSSSSSYPDVSGSGSTYVAWCWKAGGAAVSNTDGTITSTVSANQDAGFSIATFTTPTNNNFSIGHGLNLAPELVFLKSRSGGSSWTTYAQPIGATKYLFLNSTAAATTSALPFNDTPPTDSVINLGSATVWYGTSADWVSYCFHSVDGYQKVGSYTGSGSTVTVTTGFEPRFVMIKRTNNVNDWIMFDTVRSGGSDMDDYLVPNSSSAEYSNSTIEIQAISNGFTAASGLWTGLNVSGGEYIYLAIA